MTKKLETVKLISNLERAYRKTKKNFWKDLAERLKSPSRNNVVVSVEKINEIAKARKAKVVVVPGKVLSGGELEDKLKVVAVSASKAAIRIIIQKGEFVYLKDFVNDLGKTKLSEVIIVK